jgi:hypothetical protein
MCAQQAEAFERRHNVPVASDVDRGELQCVDHGEKLAYIEAAHSVSKAACVVQASLRHTPEIMGGLFSSQALQPFGRDPFATLLWMGLAAMPIVCLDKAHSGNVLHTREISWRESCKCANNIQYDTKPPQEKRDNELLMLAGHDGKGRRESGQAHCISQQLRYCLHNQGHCCARP